MTFGQGEGANDLLAVSSPPKRMKLLFVTKSRYGWGTFVRAWNLGAELSKLGHNVTLVCSADQASAKTSVENVREGFRVIRLPRIRHETLPQGMALRACVIALSIRTSDYDLVQTFAPAFPDTWWPVLAAKLNQKPVVIDIDDWWGFDPEHERRLTEWTVQEILEGTAVLLGSQLTAVSRELLTRRAGLARSAGLEIPNGVDSGLYRGIDRNAARDDLRLKLGLSPDDMLIVLIHDDRFEGIVNELTRLMSSNKFPGKILIIGTSEAARRRLEPLVRESRVLVVRPRLDHIDMARTISAGDISLFLMDDVPFDHARFPMKVPEYLATGRPIVASAFGRTYRLLDEVGYHNEMSNICVPLQAQSLYDAIEKVRTSYIRFAAVAEAAREFVLSEFDWGRIARRLETVYAGLLNR